VTVTTGVVTVAVVPSGAVTVAVTIGVDTVAATVAGSCGIGRVGREEVGSRSAEGANNGGIAAAVEAAGTTPGLVLSTDLEK